MRCELDVRTPGSPAGADLQLTSAPPPRRAWACGSR